MICGEPTAAPNGSHPPVQLYQHRYFMVTCPLQRFSQFLGRYGRGMASPYKVYKVPTVAEKVTFEIDFYEIDSWDNSERFGQDQIDIYIDGETLALGTFFD